MRVFGKIITNFPRGNCYQLPCRFSKLCNAPFALPEKSVHIYQRGKFTGTCPLIGVSGLSNCRRCSALAAKADDTQPTEAESPQSDPTGPHSGFESMACYELMQKTARHSKFLVPPLIVNPIKRADAEELLRKDWSEAVLPEFTDALTRLHSIDSQDATSIPSYYYDNISLGLVRALGTLTDKDDSIALLCVLPHLRRKLSASTNYTSLCTILDQHCRRLFRWLSTDEAFLVSHCFRSFCSPTFFRNSTFLHEAITTLGQKPSRFSTAQLLQLCFLLNHSRKANFNMYELEHCIENRIHEMSTEELSIVALAFFKTETHVQNKNLVNYILQRATRDADSLTMLSLNSFLKFLRHNAWKRNLPLFRIFLGSLCAKVDTMPISCLSQLAHCCAILLIHDKSLLEAMTKRYSTDLQQVRLKDIERFSLYISRMNISSDDSICKDMLEELRRTYDNVRATEILSFPLTFVSTLANFSYRNVYEPELIDFAMSKTLRSRLQLPPSNLRDLWVLDCNVALDLPEYSGARLSTVQRMRFAKISEAESEAIMYNTWLKSLTMKIVFTLKGMYKSESCVHVKRLLPQYHQWNVILCLDKDFKEGVPVTADFFPAFLCEPKYLSEKDSENRKWFAFDLVTVNKSIRGTNMACGMSRARVRHIQRLGYRTVEIEETIWNAFRNETERTSYLRECISTSEEAGV